MMFKIIAISLLTLLISPFNQKKDTLEVWINGKKPDVDSLFIDEGTEMVFSLTNEEKQEASIKVVSSGKKKEGIIYNFFVNNQQIPESIE